MTDKSMLITELMGEMASWKALLGGMSEAQLLQPASPGSWSVKDIVGHLYAWQQVTLARLAAGREAGVPVFPDWVLESDPDNDDLLEEHNARIYRAAHQRSWSEMFQLWQSQFTRILALAEEIPDEALTTVGRYPWLGEYALSAVLNGTLEHHREHREPIGTSILLS